MRNKLLILGATGLIAVTICVMAVSAQTTGNNLHGWAWSSNIGWISFNSTDSGASGGSAYAVTVNNSGNFSGYAWSPSIGWISFNAADLSAAPACQGSATVTPAMVSTTTGAVTGWVRAVAGKGTAGYPSGISAWDGCIQLSDSTGPTDTQLFPTGVISGTKGVTYNPATGQFRGYAWGGTNVGWISFSPTISGWTPLTCDNNCTPLVAGNVYVASCLASVVPSGSLFNITWTANAASGKPPYTYTWDGVSSGALNTFTLNNVSVGTYSKTLVVIDKNGSSSPAFTCSASAAPLPVVVTPGNEIALTIRKSTAAAYSGTNTLQVPKGTQFSIDWSIPSIFVTGDCASQSITTPTGGQNDPSWGSAWTQSNIESSLPNGQLGPLGTAGSNIGIYRFNLSCSHTDTVSGAVTTKSGTATLRVTTSNIIEI